MQHLRRSTSVFTLILLGIIVGATAQASLLEAVRQGDFEVFSPGESAPLGQAGNPWTILTDPAGQSYGISLFDASGEGAASRVLWARTGYGSVVLSQTVSLAGGYSYDFSAAIASVSAAPNADGGTFAATIGSLVLASHSFGMVLPGQQKRAVLSGVFTPVVSGDYLLAIEIERSYQSSSLTPICYIDNISLSRSIVPEPGTLLLSGIGLIGVRRFQKRFRG